MIATERLLERAKAHRSNPNAHGAMTADILETAAWDVGLVHKAKLAIEAKLAATPSIGDAPFGMDTDEARLYLAGKAAGLQWVLELLP